jgi:O-antigen ligase
LWLAVGSAASILVSIAVSQILLALALSALLLSGLPLRWPRASAGLGLFLLWTLLSLAFSPDPAHGTAQIRKMFVFLILLVFYSSVRSLAESRWLVYAWAVLGTVTAGRGFYQYLRDITLAREANMDFYHYYIAGRISGFMSHWMTFSGQQLFILLMVGAWLLFAPARRERWWLWLPCGAVVGLSLVLSDTRSVWLATLAGGFYLLWRWNVRAALAMPVLVAVGLLFAPAAVKQRAVSIVKPEKETDSNAHRITAWRTGLQMARAHPVFGVGPEEIAKPEVFDSYVPSDIPRPLPTGFYGHLHSIYVHYAAERGIPAALLLIGALLYAIWRFRLGVLKLPAGRSYPRFLLEFSIASIIGVMVSGVFELNLGDSEVLTMFLVILCIGEIAINAGSNSELRHY